MSFAGSDEAFANPERGFFQYTETHYDDTGAGHVPLNASELSAARTTLARSYVFRYAVMEKFLSQDELDGAWLDLLADDLDAVRTAGCKIMPRFAYSTSGDTTAPYGADPPVARVLGHIAQIAPVLNAAADVVDAVQAGFIGMWGEWYYSDNFGDLGSATVTEYNDRLRVVSALLDQLDPSITVLLRYPGLKARWT